jgi:nicotinamide-nucleotide amidase
MSAELILSRLRSEGKKLIFAESLTGGLLVDAFVSIPGASDVVLGSEVTYASELKVALLGVDEDMLASKGAVSPEVASAMASGVHAVGQAALDLSPKDVISVATTGNAGPLAQSSQPVGKVFIAINDGTKSRTKELNLTGDRAAIREGAVAGAVEFLREHLGL